MKPTPTTPEELNRDYILDLARNNPIVYNFLTYHTRGNLTYEQALIGMVAHLAIYNERLIKLKTEKINTQIPDGFIVKLSNIT